MTEIFRFKIFVLACLVGYSIALRRPSWQSRSKPSMTAIGDVKTATIAFGLFLSPANAATMLGSAPTTFGSNSYKPPPLIVEKSNSMEKTPPPSVATKLVS